MTSVFCVPTTYVFYQYFYSFCEFLSIAAKIILINVAILILTAAQYPQSFILLFLLGLLVEGLTLNRR